MSASRQVLEPHARHLRPPRCATVADSRVQVLGHRPAASQLAPVLRAGRAVADQVLAPPAPSASPRTRWRRRTPARAPSRRDAARRARAPRASSAASRRARDPAAADGRVDRHPVDHVEAAGALERDRADQRARRRSRAAQARDQLALVALALVEAGWRCPGDAPPRGRWSARSSRRRRRAGLASSPASRRSFAVADAHRIRSGSQARGRRARPTARAYRSITSSISRATSSASGGTSCVASSSSAPGRRLGHETAFPRTGRRSAAASSAGARARRRAGARACCAGARKWPPMPTSRRSSTRAAAASTSCSRTHALDGADRVAVEHRRRQADRLRPVDEAEGEHRVGAGQSAGDAREHAPRRRPGGRSPWRRRTPRCP